MEVIGNGKNIDSSLACLLFFVDLVKTPLVYTQLQHKINIRAFRRFLSRRLGWRRGVCASGLPSISVFRLKSRALPKKSAWFNCFSFSSDSTDVCRLIRSSPTATCSFVASSDRCFFLPSLFIHMRLLERFIQPIVSKWIHCVDSYRWRDLFTRRFLLFPKDRSKKLKAL